MVGLKKTLTLIVMLSSIGIVRPAMAQKGTSIGPAVRKGAGLWCQTCQPAKAAVFAGQRALPADTQPNAISELQTTTVYSPSELTYLRTPANQVVGGELWELTQALLPGPLTAKTLITSPAFVSPGAFTAELDFSVDLYCAGNSQQVGFYHAFWIEEDLGAGPCLGGASCGYLVQNTLLDGLGNPLRYGVSGVVYQQTPPGDTNFLVSETIPYTVSTVPGATYRVRVDVWPFHYGGTTQWIGWGSTRMRIIKGPGGLCQ